MGAIEAEKVQEGAKMMRKGATKMGPHQADSVLKAALNEHGQNMTELDQLDGSKTNLGSRDGFWWVKTVTKWPEEGGVDAKKCHKNGSTPGRFGFEGSIEPKRSICTEKRRDITDLDKVDTIYVKNGENHGIRPKKFRVG